MEVKYPPGPEFIELEDGNIVSSAHKGWRSYWIRKDAIPKVLAELRVLQAIGGEVHDSMGIGALQSTCRYCAAPDPAYPRDAKEVPAIVWCITHQRPASQCP